MFTKTAFNVHLLTLMLLVGLVSGAEDVTSSKPDSNSSKPVHVALVVGCHSHARLHSHIAHSLQNEAAVGNKYRVTFVTGQQCRYIPERIDGVKIFDTGVWYYPSTDPNMKAYDYLQNYTLGEVTYPARSIEALIKTDKPDVIISDNVAIVSGTIAEKYDIPFAVVFRQSFPPISMYAAGHNLGLGFTFSHIPDPSMPDWYFALGAAFLYRVQIAVGWLGFGSEAYQVVKTMREEANLSMFDSYYHAINIYPVIAYFDDTIVARKDIHPRLTTVGILPHEPDLLSRMDEELMNFIESSSKAILYVSIGTRNTFTDEQSEVMIVAFEKQPHYNVIWAHRTWNETKMGKIDESRIIVRKDVPQREILSHPKVKVFYSHLATGAFTEGVSRETVFIASPQKLDHFYMANSVTKHNMGVIVNGEPTEREILEAIENVFSNYEQYHTNVIRVKQHLMNNSVSKLESIVDWLAEQKHVVVFDFEESLIISVKNALFVLGTILTTFISIPIVCVFLIIRKCLRTKKTIKTKTN